jgi:hypothetical protein
MVAEFYNYALTDGPRPFVRSRGFLRAGRQALACKARPIHSRMFLKKSPLFSFILPYSPLFSFLATRWSSAQWRSRPADAHKRAAGSKAYRLCFSLLPGPQMESANTQSLPMSQDNTDIEFGESSICTNVSRYARGSSLARTHLYQCFGRPPMQLRQKLNVYQCLGPPGRLLPQELNVYQCFRAPGDAAREKLNVYQCFQRPPDGISEDSMFTNVLEQARTGDHRRCEDFGSSLRHSQRPQRLRGEVLLNFLHLPRRNAISPTIRFAFASCLLVKRLQLDEEDRPL